MYKYKHPILFFTLSLIIPWALWFTVAYYSHQPEGLSNFWKGLFELAGLLSPVGVATYLFTRDKLLLTDLKARFIGKNLLTNRYFWVALLFPPLSIIVAQLLSLDLGHGLEQFYISGKPSFSSAPFSAWFVLCLAPVVEELAWHTYGTDALRSRWTLFTSSVIFTVYWGLWHLPLFFVKDYYQSNVQAEGMLYTANFFVSLFTFVFIINWLYYKSGRSVLVAILFHLVANVSNEIFATHPDSKVIQTGLFAVLTGYILVKERWLFFGREVV
ncbi:CPBP family intramembrane metalloprotease [Capnocytophaga sp. HP1101]